MSDDDKEEQMGKAVADLLSYTTPISTAEQQTLELLGIMAQNILASGKPDFQFDSSFVVSWGQAHLEDTPELLHLPKPFESAYAMGRFISRHIERLKPAGIMVAGKRNPGPRWVYNVVKMKQESGDPFEAQ